MLQCSICADPSPTNVHCAHAHPGLCHWCGRASCSQSLGYYDHPDPEAPPPPLVLSPRDVAALVQYQRHVQRTVGVQGLRDLVTEEEGTG